MTVLASLSFLCCVCIKQKENELSQATARCGFFEHFRRSDKRPRQNENNMY
jgi:hypothetical protein